MTTHSGEALAARLIDLVLDAALDIHVVIVVRADQYAALTTIRRLAELLDDAQVLVGPPSDDELRRIIEVPARRTGCVAERTLVEAVIEEVADHHAALPLVSAALADVWERRDGDTLTEARFVEIGGIAAAVERLGERAVEQVGDAEAIRQVMIRLVDITDEGQWVRRRLPVDDVPDELARAVDALVDARLVRRDDERGRRRPRGGLRRLAAAGGMARGSARRSRPRPRAARRRPVWDAAGPLRRRCLPRGPPGGGRGVRLPPAGCPHRRSRSSSPPASGWPTASTKRCASA